MVVANYALVMTFMPAVLVLDEMYLFGQGLTGYTGNI